jgi:hypothetical protein
MLKIKKPLPEPSIVRIKINELIKMKIIVPICQREKEWDDDMYMNAIDSIINNIDIGQIIVTYSTEHNRYGILDGQHRYEAIVKCSKTDSNLFELICNKKITFCKYLNLTDEEQTRLYMRINSGLEQNIEHMERINDIKNITNFIDIYTNQFEIYDNLDILINALLYVIQDYYYNGEVNIIVKNLNKKNHYLKNLNKINEDYESEDNKKIMDITKYVLDEIIKSNKFFNIIKGNKKTKSIIITSIIYHIMHEFYDSIKNKTFVFNSKIDIFYNGVYNMLLQEKNPKVKDNFNLLMSYYMKYINNILVFDDKINNSESDDEE